MDDDLALIRRRHPEDERLTAFGPLLGSCAGTAGGTSRGSPGPALRHRPLSPASAISGVQKHR
jgi:hypothetical protein